MRLQKRVIILITVIIAVGVCGFIVWNESFYLDMVPFLSPIEYAGNLQIRNDSWGKGDFGKRRSGNRRHQGIDLLAPIGTPVRASKGGIAFACEYNKGIGKFIKIKHRHGLVTIYGHLSKIYIKPIQRVRQGWIIGEVGKTGNARYNGIQPHLHFEIRGHGVAVDPKRYLYQ